MSVVSATHDNAFHLTGNWITLASLIVATAIAMLSGMYKFHRDRQADAKLAREAADRATHEIQQGISHMGAELEDRLSDVEKKNVDFLPRPEIERQIEVERRRACDAEAGLVRRMEQQERSMSDVQAQIARLDAHQVDLNSGMKRLEADLKTHAQEMANQLTRITDILLGRAK